SGVRSRRPMKRTRTPSSTRSGSSRSIVSAKISISALTSSCGRDQFSVENAKIDRSWMPRSIAASTTLRTARAPARCPAAGGRPRFDAQRPLPSRMIATEPATSGRSGSINGLTRVSVRKREIRFSSDLHHFRFFALQQIVDLRDVLVGELLHARLGRALLVVADIALLHQLLEMLDRVAANVAHGDAAFLRHLPDHLDELLAPLLGELRDRQPDELAVVRRREPEIGLLDRLLDRLDLARVERLDRQHPRLRRADRRHVLQRGRRPVVVDLDAVEERGRRPAGAHRVEVLVRRLDRLVHPLGCVTQEVLDHDATPSATGVEMIVPTRSPRTTRSMLPGASSKTWIGRWLSMQSERAVVSMTFSPRSIACRCVSSGISFASGSTRGSPSRTPSTPFFAMRIASAPISSARSAAAVSVVKNGLPVPAAKMTTRPFSRWRTARRRMYGSATSWTSIAESTRVSAPFRSSASCTASAFSTVASIPM